VDGCVKRQRNGQPTAENNPENEPTTGLANEKTKTNFTGQIVLYGTEKVQTENSGNG